MRTGLTVSAATHTVILAAILIGFANPMKLEEPPVDAITVDLVPLSDTSNVRSGTLDSKVVNTPSPAIVKSDQPAKLAQPTGNTEKDQATPEKSDKPTPAPTVQTAPKPAPAPAPKPEPTPTPPPKPVTPPAPKPAPAPKPEPAPAPMPKPAPEPKPAPAPAAEQAPKPVAPPTELATAPTTPDADTPVAPKPAAQADLAQKRAAFLKQQQAEQKADEPPAKTAEQSKPVPVLPITPDTQQPDNRAAKAADEISQLINDEATRGAKTGAGGNPTLGKTTGTAATLTQSDIDALTGQIDKCLSVPIGAKENNITAYIRIAFNADGSVAGTPTIARPPASALEQALGSAAVRAVMQCGPYSIVAQKYNLLAEVGVLVDPSKFQ